MNPTTMPFLPNADHRPALQPHQPLPRKGQRPTMAPVHRAIARAARREAARAFYQKAKWLL